MYKFFFLFFILPYILFAQIPDYSDLSRRDKLKFLNYYGYIQLKSGDTIYCKVKYDFNNDIVSISNEGEAIVSYPKELKDYEYQKKIPLNDIDKLFFGFPKKTEKLVKAYNGRHIYIKRPKKIGLKDLIMADYDYRSGPIVVTKILEGKYTLYKTLIISENSNFFNIGYSRKTDSFGNGSGIVFLTELYLQKPNGPLIAILGDRKKEESKKILTTFLKDDIDPAKLKKLRMRTDKITAFLKALNAE